MGKKQSAGLVTEKNTWFDKVVHEAKHTAMANVYSLF